MLTTEVNLTWKNVIQLVWLKALQCSYIIKGVVERKRLGTTGLGHKGKSTKTEDWYLHEDAPGGVGWHWNSLTHPGDGKGLATYERLQEQDVCVPLMPHHKPSGLFLKIVNNWYWESPVVYCMCEEKDVKKHLIWFTSVYSLWKGLLIIVQVIYLSSVIN